MSYSNNLLVTLNKLASGQQENFLSDAFVHLLNLLAQEVPAAFSMVIEEMTHGIIKPTHETTTEFVITPQIATSAGTPDIEIRGPDTYALIEVKDESPVDVEQIDRYTRLIKQNDAGAKCLVLLTRHQAPILGKSCLLKTIRWTQVTEWLIAVKGNFDIGPAPYYNLQQFLEFLEAKGMSINRAGWEMVSGIQQFQNFKVLLKQAMESAGAHKVWASGSSEHNGWSIPDPTKKGEPNLFYVMIRLDEPHSLIFLCKLKDVIPEFLQEWTGDKYELQSRNRVLDLNSEDVHFFSRSLDSQRAVLEAFVSSCLAQTTYRPPT